MSFQNKCAVVTGGAQGIGRATVKYLLERGAKVAVGDADAEAGEEVVRAYAGLGELHFIQTDVSSESSAKTLVSETVERFGALDYLVNNAGTMIRKSVTNLSLDEWNKVVGINLTGVFLCTKYAAPHLEKAQGTSGGAIVNVASSRAIMSEPDTESYAASKGGVVALTHALSVSLGPGVRVNCVSPGWIVVNAWQKEAQREEVDLRPADREQHPVGRVGTPEDVASLIGYLLGDESGFITGQNFVVDGGMTRKMIYVE